MTERDAKPADGGDDDALIAEVRERYELCATADSENHANGLDDLQFLSGDQWDPRAKALREREGRPCLTINRLPSFLHQVTNDLRQNVPSIKVHPVDDDADEETAEVLQGLIRHIEYGSNADVAYDTAVISAASIGFGFFRMVTQYVGGDTFDQEIRLRRIRNPFTVRIDPASEEPDGSDARFAIISTKVPRDEFQRLHPDAQATGAALGQGLGDQLTSWLFDEFVRVAEYYRVEHKAATLIQLTNGETGWKDELIELPEGVSIAQERKSFKREVWWYKVTGCEVLERAQIPCQWIPVFPVYGDELDVDGTVIRSGLVRNAKDPARMYNVWMTAATEEIGMRPKTPWVGAEGQFEGHEARWSQANSRAFSYLEYKPVSLGGMLAPPPQRQAMADVPAGVLTMARHASDDIKATTGIFDASLGAQGNETSGTAITARQREGDVGNFHYADNLNRTLRHAGRCLVDMIPRIYDTERIVRIMGDDETIKSVTVNKPMARPEVNERTQAIKTVLHDLTVGRYDVTVSAGPSYSTLRQESADAMIQFGQSWPRLMDIAGDKVVKAMDWPGADEIAERIKRTVPPQILGDEGQEGGQAPQIPPEVQQRLQQADQMIQQLQQALQEAQNGIEVARIRAESAAEVARINAEGRQDVEELKGAVQMLLQRMQPPPQLAAEVAGDLIEDDDSRPMPGPGMDQAQVGSTAAPGGMNPGPQPLG